MNMKSEADIDSPKRAYRQTSRAQATEETATRILDAFSARIRDDWFDQVTLEQVARDAGVTVPTIIRRFGNKEGLLSATQQRMDREILGRRTILPGDIHGAVRVVIEDYEAVGDLVMRSLAQEDRYAGFKTITDVGRAGHREWIEGVFRPWLDGLDAGARQARLDGLVIATDLYVWKLVRRDMGRTTEHLRALMLQLIDAIIGAERRPTDTTGEKPND